MGPVVPVWVDIRDVKEPAMELPGFCHTLDHGGAEISYSRTGVGGYVILCCRKGSLDGSRECFNDPNAEDDQEEG